MHAVSKDQFHYLRVVECSWQSYEHTHAKVKLLFFPDRSTEQNSTQKTAVNSYRKARK